MNDEIFITKKENLKVIHKAEHEPYEYNKYEITSRQEFDQCYVAIYEIPPQKCNYPYHYHTENTEVFYIISGQGILETPSGIRSITAGDIVVCPPSENSAHRIKNTSETEVLTYVDYDTANSPDILHYPHSRKTGIVTHNQGSVFFKDETEADYYDGE